MTRRWRRLGNRGSTAVEFAVVGWMMCLVIFAIFETGLLWWAKSGMQITASMTARCGSIGYTYGSTASSCVDTASTQNFAVNKVASFWVIPNMITASNVTVTGRVSDSASCNAAPGNYFQVSISSNFLSLLTVPLGADSYLTTKACYPMP